MTAQAPDSATGQQREQPEPGKPLGDNAPKLADLQNQLCPNCKTGVLYVTRYDPDAEYEKGQDLSQDNQLRSGGAYARRCFTCDYSDSVAFNQEKP